MCTGGRGGGIVLEVAIYFTACFYNLVEVKRAKIRGADAHKFTSRLALGGVDRGCQGLWTSTLKEKQLLVRDVEIIVGDRNDNSQHHGQ
jgi:hypothetical protein